MLVSGVSWDLKWLLQFVFSAFVMAIGLHTLVKNTASKYFEVDANFEGEQHHAMPGLIMDDSLCAVCRNHGNKKCSRCKSVRYCSQACQQAHWKSEHKMKCKELQSTSAMNLAQTGPINRGFRASAPVNRSTSSIALIPECGSGTSRPIKQPKNDLFPYNEFVNFFNWDKPGFPPCGLLNCGNSCFANVVLQCLSFTRPLIAYLLEKGHRRECCHNDWCFLCEFEIHVEKARIGSQAFSPMNILSRLPNIGGTLGYGRQEDAHEFMRFAIDAMQSVCLDEFGGEKAVLPKHQETTLIQHIFGGHLQSEVICTECEKNSNQYENMMDLTVEIHGDAASLEECLDQFTAKEWLHGENMYKCDGCKGYVKAWKRLTVKRAPNILTIALKRFQSGRFGKLNKRVTFPETLDLNPYMSEIGDGSDIYKLYAVVVHIDMLNASFFGHYICYIKDFCGNWYRIDDWKVTRVELEEVLSQGAYMLLYSRVSARPSGLQIFESSETAEAQTVKVDVQPGLDEQAECLSDMQTVTSSRGCEVFQSHNSPELKVSVCENMTLTGMNSGVKRGHTKDVDVIDVANETSCSAVESSSMHSSEAVKDLVDINMERSNLCSPVLEQISGFMEVQNDMAKSDPSPCLPNGFSCFDKDSAAPGDYQNKREESEHVDVIKCTGNANYSNGYASANNHDVLVEDGDAVSSGIGSFSTETSSAEMHQLKRRLSSYSSEADGGNDVKKMEISGNKLVI
ncbi:ubiquitin carboxyl-terminal hydrolase 18-like [Abrus precatorius]|uniref:ubiquitinyl hydrolase 1 n=1 Tax=Abrus precatorius TaxID=3816 RepID=A0A8B8LD29_ABRPR|nr:ubiquitin carboxyl-terminal hydrolase 18-like [Abrus precatorius]XP_027354133.1 ubiquitin carboxyl-terminal hydrolase 18-like [Abrus precatorius]XP_027354134.1 ubiquitin carboxyl-terminal hydrolase 18-like [Abrus precatorius]XP_027354135.1 ubiquitin carboxyl-terminal hydrolase 18-like [Abrus precatorius]